MLNLYPFLTYVVVTTFTPGPNNILAMSGAMRYGYRRTLRFLAGIVAGFFVIMLASGVLNVALASLLPSVERWLALLGAVYMVYLAIHVVRSGPVENDPGKPGLNSFAGGFALQFLNLKLILYGVTVFAMFITPAFHDPVRVSLFAAALALAGFIATSCWALGGHLFRGFLRDRYKLFNYVMAALLLYIAVAGLLPHA